MNIKEAKEEIRHTLLAYNKKDARGHYTFPRLRQRPILLMGPPGIGKTAIMEQVAEECDVGLVAYTITHHTRQSAVGLPRIVTRCYNGKEVSITEYTLSEIIASVYDCMERTGKKEGILFIDEINCVSETLAPTMLQFLQNKTFGSHSVPEGWLIAAAGNPPEYNKSVREFDIVTLDRVRRMDIAADLDVWMEYAWKKGIHGAILSYLSMKKEHFYSVENTVDGKFFVTARGWEDLSEILKAYEELGVGITENLIGEYLCRDEIARSFFASYQLYRKYGTDYGLDSLLSGNMQAEERVQRVKMAQEASFEERFLVTGLLLDGLDMTALEEFTDIKKKSLAVRQNAELLSEKQETQELFVIQMLENFSLTVRKEHITDTENGFRRIKELFGEMVEKRKAYAGQISRELERAFAFMGDCFGDGQEMVLFVTGLTRNGHASAFIGEYGCEPYFACSEKLLYRKQEKKLQEECEALLKK